jgi:peroxiredoxin Q/BCP
VISVGDKTPPINLKDTDGRTVKLSDFKGKRVVLYFYPRDLTPGCTQEACGFQADVSKLARKNAVVIGVSTDDEKTHQRFREKYDLSFTLLCDTDHKLAEAYGVWQEKNMYGRKTWGVKRSTFIIDENGRLAHIFGKVSPGEHSKEVLDTLEKLG